MKRYLLGPLFLTLGVCRADDPSRVLPPGQKPADSRLTRVRTLNDKDFVFTPPSDLKAWETRRRELREQVLVANGLWPMPPKTPLNPVIHGKIDRDEYTIEKVFFASYPGHYVTGNLYRSKNKDPKRPAVLVAHGHWADARLADFGTKAAQEQMKIGAEKTEASARFIHQAMCVQLARMGCVVFQYDMVGHSDSKDIEHTKGFLDVDAELRLQSFMGLQTWNSIRSLDFVLSLPDVDPKRVAITGASGGGTQSFILAAVDDRLAAAFPAVMVSTEMQGGCICENCSYLRQGTGNVEIAATFAPKPLGMTGADDWTEKIETSGLTELKALYKLYGAEDKVMAKCFPEFKHNYNQVSREVMYNWFNRHLSLNQKEPVTERPFEPVPPKELSVFDDAHPHPKDAVNAERLRLYMTEESDKQIMALRPTDAKSLEEYRKVMGTALRVMVNDKLPTAADVQVTRAGQTLDRNGTAIAQYVLSRKGQNESIRAEGIFGPLSDGTIVLWIHPDGRESIWKDGKLTPAAQQIINNKGSIIAVDIFGTGSLKSDKMPTVDPKFAGYTFGYNRPLVAQRVHDILTAVAFAKGMKGTSTVHLVGFDKAGPWVLLARPLCGDAVARTVADGNEFRYETVRFMSDDMMLPGALKYGGLHAFTALAAPAELWVPNHHGTGSGRWIKAAYAAAGKPENYHNAADKATPEKMVEWLLR
jgi:dienelactone hydrolase